jgi:hypothetical protein
LNNYWFWVFEHSESKNHQLQLFQTPSWTNWRFSLGGYLTCSLQNLRTTVISEHGIWLIW